MINWNEEKFAKMTQWQKDEMLDKILRNNRDDDHAKILASDQISKRRKKEVLLKNTSLTKREQMACTKNGLEIEF